MHTELPELFYWLALSRIAELRSIDVSRLLRRFGSAEAIFLAASPAELRSLGIKDGVSTQIRGVHESRLLRRGIDQDLHWLSVPGNHLLTVQDKAYPPLLREIADPPSSLFVQGDPAQLTAPQIAIVGSRKASRLGLQSAFNFARQLSNTGFVVTSGLALGIDAESHRGAMRGEKPTLAVLGSGLCQLYPKRHRRLAEQIIADGGCLISEFPLHAPALPFHFPRRNRIISGLTLGTLVIEAELRSGSLITARLALEQNREVFAMPGSIYDPRSSGCHWLIKQGAKLVENLSDILEEFNELPAAGPGNQPLAQQDSNYPDLSREEQQLMRYLDHDPVTIDELLEASNAPVTLITAALVSLEIKGLVRAEGSGYALIPKELRS